MTFASLFQDLILLFTFLLAGFVIREFVKPLQRFYIPASIVGGVLAPSCSVRRCSAGWRSPSRSARWPAS
ncbi:MAG: hypothetical protein J6E31_05720 [Pyramidobacter sp.]|nr:hypothetical protein [Pyramidobacter sp.]